MKNNQLIGFIIICSTLILTSCVQKTMERTVTFEVDMTQQTDVTSVAVRGDDEPLSWRQDYTLTDSDGDGIYTGSVTFLTPYHTTRIKFVKNGFDYELKDKENRIITLKDQDSQVYAAVYDVEK